MKRILSLLGVILVLSALVLTGCKKTSEYESRLFQTGIVHTINIELAQDDWNDLLEHPTDKTKYHADITIDGETLSDVSFATKGNSSLFFVAADPDSSRYSFKVNFSKFNKDQSYHGLSTLNLNNGFRDATYMKDYLSYRMFAHAGVPAPLTSYVWLIVNGEDRGLYLAVEDENKSFLKRAFKGKGVIYKPENKDLNLSADKAEEISQNGLPIGGEAHGADLVYKDEDPKSYPDIFENAETKTTDRDDKAVVQAMKALSEGADLNKYLDTDEILRYFAVHNFVLNYDSYTGGMLHNLVLYENDGKLQMIPWDYNLAFGTFVPGVGNEVLDDPTDLINLGIDSPLIGAAEDQRPLWKWIMTDEMYRTQYHETMDSFVTSYFESGEYENELKETAELIRPYVEKDPTAFYSAEEFEAGWKTLQKFCGLRAESVRLQLNGTLSSVSNEQDSRNKVSASGLDVMNMGAFTAGE